MGFECGKLKRGKATSSGEDLLIFAGALRLIPNFGPLKNAGGTGACLSRDGARALWALTADELCQKMIYSGRDSRSVKR